MYENFTNSIFKEYFNKNYKTYINSWYIPQCRFFKDYIEKCFQVPYGNSQTLSFYSLENLFYLHLYYLLPGSRHLNAFNFFKDKFNNIDTLSLTFNWYKDNFLSQRKNFLSELKKNESNFIFYHSIMPHPPIIYNPDSEKLFDRYEDSLNYLKLKNLRTDLNGYNLDNFYLLDKLIGNVFLILNEKNILNSTTIIMNGDTGLSINFKDSNMKSIVKNSDDLNGFTLVSIKNKNQNTGKIIDSQMNPKDFYEKIISLAD